MTTLNARMNNHRQILWIVQSALVMGAFVVLCFLVVRRMVWEPQFMILSRRRLAQDCRKGLRPDIFRCQLLIQKEARSSSLIENDAFFRKRLIEIVAEKTTRTPTGHPDAFHVWFSTNPQDWLPPFEHCTNLVIVALNQERFGNNFQWWAAGTLFATSDSNLTEARLEDTNRWVSTISYHPWPSDGSSWWRYSEGETLLPLSPTNTGVWNIPMSEP